MTAARTTREKKVCLLTGAGGRLGSAFCRRHAHEYDIVAVCRTRRPAGVADQDRWRIDPLAAEEGALAGPEVFTICADLTAEGAIDRVVELALARFGRIDLVVNAAVFVQRERLTTLADSTAFLEDAFRVNSTIPLQLAAAVAREAWFDSVDDNRAWNRNVINVSSGAGIAFAPVAGLAAYSASKSALNFLTCALAAELEGLGVRVNALAPTTFPDLIPTAVVADTIAAVDGESYTGRVVDLTTYSEQTAHPAAVDEQSRDYLAENASAWDYWASMGSISSRPIGSLEPHEARAMLDPDGWLRWPEIERVLCIGAAGGQQAPAFAMLGCDVTLVDLSGRQLELDRAVAAEHGLTVECVQGDMCALESLVHGRFDLVYQPISSCYVADVGLLYRQVNAVLRPGGLYRVEHWNPTHMRFWSDGLRTPAGYTLAATGSPSDPFVTSVSVGPDGSSLVTARTFPHSLEALLGSLCDSGFAISRLAEDKGGDAEAAIGSEERLAAFLPPFFRLLARKLPVARGSKKQSKKNGRTAVVDAGR